MRAGSMFVWRVLEVAGIGRSAPTTAAHRLVLRGIDVSVTAPSGAAAIAQVRVEHPPARRVWLYAATCVLGAGKANPNPALVPPFGRAET
jgi:hypothetical protein